jgi:hypothetical protein
VVHTPSAQSPLENKVSAVHSPVRGYLPQSCVEDRVVVGEELERVAARGRPERHRLTPALGRRRIRAQVRRDGARAEEVDRDAGLVPAHRVRAAAVGVVRGAEALLVVSADTAALVARRRRRAVLPADKRSGHPERRRGGRGEGAARVRVDRRLVGDIVGDAFNDVDLAASGPIGTVGPERRCKTYQSEALGSVVNKPTPGSTAGWHMLGRHDEECTVVAVPVRDPHALACALDLRGRLDGHNEVPVRVDVGEVGSLRVVRVNERHCAIGGVRAGEEVPVVEEVVSGLASRSALAKHRNKGELT